MDGIVLDRLGVHAERLDGGPGLPLGAGRPVLDPVGGFLAPSADHGHHFPVVIGDVQRRLERRVFPAARGGEIGVVGVNSLHLSLQLFVFTGIDGQAPEIHQVFRVVFRIPIRLHQIMDHIVDEGVHVVVLHVHDLGAAFEDEFLAAGLDIFVVADEAELMHLVQHGPLPVAHVFRMPVGIVFRRVLGDAGDHRTLCDSQIFGFHAEIVVSCCADTLDTAAQRQDVEVCLDDLVLGVLFLHLNGAQDLGDFPLDAVVILFGEDLDELLGDGGAAEFVRREM